MGHVRGNATRGQPAHENRTIPSLPGRIEPAQAANGKADRFRILDQEMIGFNKCSRPLVNPTMGIADQVMEIACGLHNLRASSRHPLAACSVLSLMSSG